MEVVDIPSEGEVKQAAEGEYLYQRLGFQPGTRWQHSSGGPVYTYIGDSEALAAALNKPRGSFYSVYKGKYWHTIKDLMSLEVVER